MVFRRSPRLVGTGRLFHVLSAIGVASVLAAGARFDTATAAPAPQTLDRAPTIPKPEAHKAFDVPDFILPDDLQSILDIATGYGNAELEETETGDPVIVGEINGVAYQLFFLDCTRHRSCKVQNFYAIWDAPGVTLATVNEWNRAQPFHKAYLTEDNFPVIELNVSVAGGTSRVQMIDAFDRWTVALAEFQAQVLDPAL